MKPYALRLERLETEKMKCKEDLDVAMKNLAKVMEAFPPQCENSISQK